MNVCLLFVLVRSKTRPVFKSNNKANSPSNLMQNLINVKNPNFGLYKSLGQ